MEAKPTLRNPDNILEGCKMNIPQATTSTQTMTPSTISLLTEGSSSEGLGYPQNFVKVSTVPETQTMGNISSLASIIPFSSMEHRVGQGDTLEFIAEKYSTTVSALMKLNHLWNPDKILEGSKMKIPQAMTSSENVTPLSFPLMTKDASSEILAYPINISKVSTQRETQTMGNISSLVARVPFRDMKHRVEEGDTLESIAEKYRTTVSGLMKLNHLHDEVIYSGSILKIDKQQSCMKHQFLVGEKATICERNAIFKGDLVNVPQPSRAPTRENPLFSFYPLIGRGEIVKSPPRLKTVKVQDGDTLADIAFEHGLSISDLQQLNNLKDDVIIEGDILALSSGPTKKGLGELRRGQRRTLRTLFSREAVSKKSDLGFGRPEIANKDPHVSDAVRVKGKWKNKKTGFQQENGKWLHFSSPLTKGVLSSPFGWRWGALHEGVDLAADQGAPVLASDTGTVTFCGWSGGYGYLLVIQHEGGFMTRYAHCCAIHTQLGQQVQRGQHVASVGVTGRTTGPHLHFEVRQNGEALDPLEWVKL